MQSEPWLERDRAMIDQLKSIGIEKGKPFNPDAKTSDSSTIAAQEAKAWLAARYDAGFPPFFEGAAGCCRRRRNWSKPAQNSFADPDAYPIDARGLAYTYAFIGIKRLGAGQFYLISIKDKDGSAFDGGKTYRLRVPPNVPVEQYWSVTAYDRRDPCAHPQHEARQPLLADRAAAEERRRLGRHLFWAQGARGQRGNWVPTDPTREFEAMFRLYAPTKALFEKKPWILPDIEKVH